MKTNKNSLKWHYIILIIIMSLLVYLIGSNLYKSYNKTKFINTIHNLLSMNQSSFDGSISVETFDSFKDVLDFNFTFNINGNVNFNDKLLNVKVKNSSDELTDISIADDGYIYVNMAKYVEFAKKYKISANNIDSLSELFKNSDYIQLDLNNVFKLFGHTTEFKSNIWVYNYIFSSHMSDNFVKRLLEYLMSKTTLFKVEDNRCSINITDESIKELRHEGLKFLNQNSSDYISWLLDIDDEYKSITGIHFPIELLYPDSLSFLSLPYIDFDINLVIEDYGNNSYGIILDINAPSILKGQLKLNIISTDVKQDNFNDYFITFDTLDPLFNIRYSNVSLEDEYDKPTYDDFIHHLAYSVPLTHDLLIESHDIFKNNADDFDTLAEDFIQQFPQLTEKFRSIDSGYYLNLSSQNSNFISTYNNNVNVSVEKYDANLLSVSLQFDSADGVKEVIDTFDICSRTCGYYFEAAELLKLVNYLLSTGEELCDNLGTDGYYEESVKSGSIVVYSIISKDDTGKTKYCIGLYDTRD